MSIIRILLLGDVVGPAGCAMVQKHLAKLREKYAINGVIVNGENSADGRGITPKLMHFFKHLGVDVVTSGNHIWHHKDIFEYLKYNTDLLRPENFPNECPGTGVTTFSINGQIIGVVNIQGRVFMREHLSCPFKAVDSALTFLQSKTKTIIVDFHAETTAEKIAMGFFLDGRVSAVVGTHTHVQTADERVLPNGTAFITDLGMAGSLNSMIGMKKDAIIRNFITQMPVKFVVETEKPYFMCGVVIEIDIATGKALKIDRIRIDDNELNVA
ncbi:TIGR00282 family metallophosphoesterase [Candidatus Dependentiae bacterium]|nr:TIGR00282 family metallophosphoesterase [Candidatus Dependentiae bacterium]